MSFNHITRRRAFKAGCMGLLGLGLLALHGGCRRKAPVEPVVETPNHDASVETWKPLAVRHHPNYGKDLSAWSSWKPHLERSLKHLQYRSALPPHLCQPALTRQDMIELLQKLIKASSSDPTGFWRSLDESFVLLQAHSHNRDPAFFTGYYSPIYHGSRRPTARFAYPIYAPPKDLKQNPKAYTRTAIEKAGVLRNQGLEVCYLASPLDVLLLHVQGSGTIQLAEGGQLGLGFAGHNAQPYQSLGKMLVERGKISARDISLRSIRQYYQNHPQDVLDLIQLNQRYIFFSKNDGRPRGSSGAVVEAFHSLATERFADRRYRFPTHMPMLIHLNLPLHGNSTLPVLCQDTGSAIRGEARADIYLGEGIAAERVAGELKHRGQMFMIWPKNLALPFSIAGNPVHDGGTMPKP